MSREILAQVKKLVTLAKGEGLSDFAKAVSALYLGFSTHSWCVEVDTPRESSEDKSTLQDVDFPPGYGKYVTVMSDVFSDSSYSETPDSAMESRVQESVDNIARMLAPVPYYPEGFDESTPSPTTPSPQSTPQFKAVDPTHDEVDPSWVNIPSKGEIRAQGGSTEVTQEAIHKGLHEVTKGIYTSLRKLKKDGLLGRTMTIPEIRHMMYLFTGLGVKDSILKDHLRRMVQRGDVTRVSRGRYNFEMSTGVI